jgi:hypothetical protein
MATRSCARRRGTRPARARPHAGARDAGSRVAPGVTTSAAPSPHRAARAPQRIRQDLRLGSDLGRPRQAHQSQRAASGRRRGREVDAGGAGRDQPEAPDAEEAACRSTCSGATRSPGSRRARRRSAPARAREPLAAGGQALHGEGRRHRASPPSFSRRSPRSVPLRVACIGGMVRAVLDRRPAAARRASSAARASPVTRNARRKSPRPTPSTRRGAAALRSIISSASPSPSQTLRSAPTPSR